MDEGLGSQSNLLVCANGHRMIAGTPVCAQCGAAPSTLGAAAPAAAAGAAKSRRTYAILAGAVGGALVIGGGVIWAVAALSGDDGPAPVPSASTSAPGTDGFVCDDPDVPTFVVGDAELITDSTTVCLEVPTQIELAVGAYPLGDSTQDLSMDVFTADGVYWAAADDALTEDPEVVAVFEPDTYVITVSAFGADALDPYAFWAVAFGDLEPSIAPPPEEVPTLADCGSDDVPLVTNNGILPLASDTPYVCFRLTTAAFAKFGAQASGTVDGEPADIRVGVFEFVDGEAQFLRSVDDYFYLDPELNIDLAAGTYLVQYQTWYGAPTGEFTAYFDSAGEFFRTVNASPEFAALTGDDCGPGGLPMLQFGETVTVGAADQPVVCVTLDAQERIYVTVNSLGVDEDLTLEVIGFETSVPQRWAWNDDSADGELVTDTDPALDVVLPAGTYALAVADFFGEAEVTSFEITVDLVD